MSATPEFNEAQLSAARATAWRQAGDPLLTLEAARDWINERGLVLFAPRAQQLPVPAPSLVEATMGAPNSAPSMAQSEVARGLVARLVGEGLALPLNLLGVSAAAGSSGDNPDFVVSAQVFSYVFTMRGDKAWKQPPSTSGAVKVSPLGLRVFEVLTERGPMSASELAQELGREVTEAAILRSLHELWSQLRVIPLLQQGGESASPTLWELTSRRFTKAMKAGANAGQPTALSALISLYLAQVFVATEEEIATFLSPLTARSRIREVLHALVGARQLETVVLEGRTLLHIPGTLPAFGAAAGEDQPVEEAVAAERPKKIGTGRIKSFSGEGKVAAEFRGKPAARSFSSAGPRKPSARFGTRPDGKTDRKSEGKSDRERRPFKKSTANGPAQKPSFTKPWTEERKARPSSKPDGFTKFRRPETEDREPLGPREQAGLPPERRSVSKPSFDRPKKPGGFEKRPYTPRTEERGERGSFKPRSYERGGERSGERSGNRSESRAGNRSGSRSGGQQPDKPGGFATKRPFTPRIAEGGERQFAKRPYAPKVARGQDHGPDRSKDRGEHRGPFKPRSFERSGERSGGERAANAGGFGPKRSYTPRTSEGGERSFEKRPTTPKPEAGGARFAKRPQTPRAAEQSDERTLPKRPYKPRAADAHTRPFTKSPWVPPAEGDSAKRPYKARSQGGFKPAGAGQRKGFRPNSSSSSGTRAGGKFGGRPGGSSGGRSGPAAGSRPTARKRPESEE